MIRIENLSKQMWEKAVRSRDPKLRRSAWSFFALNYGQEYCQIEQIDWEPKDPFGKFIFSKEEMYDGFLLHCLQNHQADQITTLIEMLITEDNLPLAAQKLGYLVMRLSFLPEIKRSLAQIGEKITAHKQTNIYAQMLDFLDEGNADWAFNLWISAIKHKTWDYVDINDFLQKMPLKTLCSKKLCNQHYKLLETIVLCQDQHLEYYRHISYNLQQLCKICPDEYQTYYNLLLDMISKQYKLSPSVEWLDYYLFDPQSPFNSGFLHPQDAIRIIDTIRGRADISNIFWNYERREMLLNWLDKTTWNHPKLAEAALPLYRFLLDINILMSENYAEVFSYKTFFSSVSRVIYFTVINDLKKDCINPKNFSWTKFDFYPQGVGCPKFLTPYGQILCDLVKYKNDVVEAKELVSLCKKLGNEYSFEILQDLEDELFCTYTAKPAIVNKLFAEFTDYSFTSQIFILQNLTNLNLVNSEIKYSRVIQVVSSGIYLLSCKQDRQIVAYAILKLADFFKDKLSLAELELIGEIICHQDLKEYFEYQQDPEFWNEAITAGRANYEQYSALKNWLY